MFLSAWLLHLQGASCILQCAICAVATELAHTVPSIVSRSPSPLTGQGDTKRKCLCHMVAIPGGMDAVAHPSNKLLGVKTLMIESSLGFTPIGGSFIKLDTSLQTVRNSCTDSPWLLTEKWIEHFASLVNDSTAFLYQGVSAGPNAQVDLIILCGASRSVMTSNQSIFFQAYSLSSLSAPTSWEPRSLSIFSGHTPIHVLANLLRAIRKLLVSYPNTAWMCTALHAKSVNITP